MINKRFCFGKLVTMLVFGMAIYGCVKAQTDTRLNGTWKSDFNINKYNSGDVEFLDTDGTPYNQGTYTTKDNKITFTVTHIFGSIYDDGLDSRWYSLDELKKDFSEIFDTFVCEYVVDNNKLTLIYDGSDSDSESYTLVNRDGKFNKAKSNNKNSVPVDKSSGRVSSFPGRWKLIEGRGDAKDVELFKDGTGTADGSGITWKVENGRFHILHPFYTFSAYYNIKGSTVIFTKEDGVVIKYQKK